MNAFHFRPHRVTAYGRRSVGCTQYAMKVLTQMIKNDFNRGPVTIRKSKFLRDKFNRFVVRSGGCWGWRGSLSSEGYSTIYRERPTRRLFAHRVSYVLYVGPIPKGLDLDHLCRNRWCVNPKHLEPVTRAENIHRGAMTKLTAEQVKEVRTAYAAETHPYKRGKVLRDYARTFNVSPNTLQQIVNGTWWKSAEGPQTKGQNRYALTEEQKKNALDLILQGKTVSQVAVLYDVASSTIRRYQRRAA